MQDLYYGIAFLANFQALSVWQNPLIYLDMWSSWNMPWDADSSFSPSV